SRLSRRNPGRRAPCARRTQRRARRARAATVARRHSTPRPSRRDPASVAKETEPGPGDILAGVPRRMRFVAVASIVTSIATSVAWSSLARADPPAQSHPLVQLVIDPCLGVPAEEVRKIVGVELGALLVPEGDAPTSDVTVVHVRCGAATELRVDDP